MRNFRALSRKVECSDLETLLDSDSRPFVDHLYPPAKHLPAALVNAEYTVENGFFNLRGFPKENNRQAIELTDAIEIRLT
jgi:hypothetical protein